MIVLSMTKGRCHICKHRIIETDDSAHPLYFELDHIHPISRGGTHWIGNLMPAHRLCNGIKSDRALTPSVVRECLAAVESVLGVA